ncbi:MAG: DUF3631 domain-containing protein [Mariprofundaceae bacterium]|nr:DUF3631 domain-containing protein [Mariprofundaceae bacterium]
MNTIYRGNTKERAQGRWGEILSRFGVDAACLDGKHRACPVCGGVDRFRFDDKDGSGSHICSQCGAGNGFALIGKIGGHADFKATAAAIDALMGWVDADYMPPTAQEKEARKARYAGEEVERQQATAKQQKEAAEQAQATWDAASPASDAHPYLKRKGVQPFGIRDDGKGRLLIPVCIDGIISSLQSISKDGVKLFTKGGKKSGGYFPMTGDDRAMPDCIVICEGYATGATISEATGHHIAVAFDAGNIHKVAQHFSAKKPKVRLVFAADNDQKSSVNTGLEAATKAALIVGGVIALPAAAAGSSVDWNDIHTEHGLEIVAAGIANALNPETLMIDNVDAPKVGDGETVANNDTTPKEKGNSHNDIITRLVELSLIEYDQVRSSEAEALGIRASTLDSLVKAGRKETNSESDIFPDIEPWDVVVDGKVLLNEIVSIFNRYAILPDHAPEVAALWVLNTYVHDAGGFSPMIMLTSPEKRCGKTTTLTLFQALVKRPLAAGNISPAVVYRAIEKWKPTLLIDEADTFLKNNEEVAGVINSGHTKKGAFVIRCEGDSHEPRQFSTWCPKVISGIGSQRDTLEDRSIIFPLRRKLPHEQVERLRLDRGGFDDVQRRCVRWGNDNFTKCFNSDPDFISGLDDRANDNWQPLLAIAELCEWGDRARLAAVLIRDEVEESESIDTVLLKDIQTIYQEQRVGRLSSQRLCSLLVAIDDRPCGEWSKGRPITPNKLAGRLKMFGIHSSTLRLPNGDRLKGYSLEMFSDAFTRYCVSDRDGVTSYTQQQKTDLSKSDSTDNVTLQSNQKTLVYNDCHAVTVKSDISPRCADNVKDIEVEDFGTVLL